MLGGQWGDEGKGKLVDILARDYDVIARFNGGSNAGHTLVVDGQKFAFHLLPCGLLYEDKVNVIGNGVVVHVPTMLKELDRLQEGGKFDQAAEQARGSQRLLISDRAHLLFDFHQTVDGQQESATEGGQHRHNQEGHRPGIRKQSNAQRHTCGRTARLHTLHTQTQAGHNKTHSATARQQPSTPISHPSQQHSHTQQ